MSLTRSSHVLPTTVEDKLEAILGQGVTAGVAAAAVEAPKGDEALLNGPQLPKNAKTQDEIDALFND